MCDDRATYVRKDPATLPRDLTWQEFEIAQKVAEDDSLEFVIPEEDEE